MAFSVMGRILKLTMNKRHVRPNVSSLLSNKNEFFWFHSSPVLCAEPLKKKKRVDPTIIRQREERKRRRIEREIRRLKRLERQLKPVDEIEVSPKILEEKSVRTRKVEPLTPEEIDERISLKREWCEYKGRQFELEMKSIECMIQSQTRALAALRFESEELYQEAIKLDPTLFPFQSTGPTNTPPIEGYDCADGVFVDVTRKWDRKPDIAKLLMHKKRDK